MSYRVGRLIGQVHLKGKDLSASRRFYAVLGALRLPVSGDYGAFVEDCASTAASRSPLG